MGPHSTTFKAIFKKHAHLIIHPWMCLSVITLWRTYDYYFNSKEDISTFHLIIESIRPSRVKELKDKNILSPEIVNFKILKEKFRMIAHKQNLKLADLLYVFILFFLTFF